MDISTVVDPTSGLTYLYWGTAKFSDENDATAFMKEGNVYIGHYDGSWIYDNLYATSGSVTLGNYTWTTPPACFAVKAFTFRGNMVVAAILHGEVSGSDYPTETHVYLYNARGLAQWISIGTLPTLQNIDYHAPEVFQLQLDENMGYDFYYPANGGVFWLNNSVANNPLPQGSWDWVSVNCTGFEDSLKYLFAGQDSLEEIRDQYGNRFRPNDDPPIDSIYVWDWMKFYPVRSYVADTFGVFGPAIPSDSSMTLYVAPQDSSWIFNYIAYLPLDSMNVNYAFVADSDSVKIVKNDDGEFWKPGDGDQFYMQPGEGYQVGVSHQFTFSYPDPPEQECVIPGIVKEVGNNNQIAGITPTHFEFTTKTGDYYAIYIEDLLINGNAPAYGDEVACYTEDDLCVGAGVYEGSFPIRVAAWKDDIATPDEVDGYTAGHTMSFIWYDVSENSEIIFELPPSTSAELDDPIRPSHSGFGAGIYALRSMVHGTSGVTYLPKEYRMKQNFPNPFNAETIIPLELPQRSHVKVDLYNVCGQHLGTIHESVMSAGWPQIRYNANHLSSGMYFYRIKAEGLERTGTYHNVGKMLLLK